MTTDPKTDSEPRRGGDSRGARQAMHVLVVDDNIVNRHVSGRMLESQGHRVDLATNGEQALDAMRSTRYAAVVMDCQMPIMDGYEATRTIRAMEGAERHTPIVAMTASTSRGDRERCLEAGMDGYVTKPVRLAELIAVLARWTGTGELDRGGSRTLGDSAIST